MDFGALALVVAAGLLGPALASTRRLGAPLVVGELIAGLVIGVSGFGWIDATSEPLASLNEIGFALLMLVAGTHLPLRDPGLRSGSRTGVAATVITFALAVPVAFGVRELSGLDEIALLVVLLASSSAAVVMPLITDRGLAGPRVVAVTAWVALSDALGVVSIPLATSDGGALRALLGSAVVVALAGLCYVGATYARRAGIADRPERLGLERGWGLRLRVSTLALFALAWVATSLDSSVLLAGFSLGFVIALLGQPSTLARELIGLGEGFLIPVYFVTLGAQLDVGAMFGDADDVRLLVVLVVGAALLHLVVAMLLRVGPAAGLVAAAQLGVPSAVASIGLTTGQLDSGQAAAVVAAAIGTVGIAAAASARLPSTRGASPAPDPA